MPNNIERVLVIDLEATCWGEVPPVGEQSDIIEVGLCMLDIRNQSVERPVSIYVKPERSTLSEYCINLTNIKPKTLLKSGVAFNQAIERLINKYGSGNKTWASFGSGDADMMGRQCTDFGLIYPFSNSHLDVQALFSMREQITKTHIGLSDAMARAGIPFEGRAHSGATDAYNTALLLGMMLWNKRPQNLWEKKPSALVCVNCGEPWDGPKNVCQCGAFCAWGTAKGADPLSWTPTQIGWMPNPVPADVLKGV